MSGKSAVFFVRKQDFRLAMGVTRRRLRYSLKSVIGLISQAVCLAGSSVCNGDSGGGMVFAKPGTSGSKTIWRLRGVVSIAVARHGQEICDPYHYVLFTDAAQYLDWIKVVMSTGG